MDAAGSSKMLERIFQTTETLKMEVVDSSEMSARFYQITHFQTTGYTFLRKDGWYL
jgi:hypothetical protein